MKQVEYRNSLRLGPVNWAICRLLSMGAGVKDAQIFSALGRTGGLFRAWLYFSAKLMPFGKLPRKDTEAVILRIAELRQCEYEREHHARIATRLGMSDEVQTKIRLGKKAFDKNDRLHTIVEATDALVGNGDLDESQRAALQRIYSDKQLIEFCLLIGHYNGLATTIKVLGIESDFG